jgi:cell division septation protein DedD
MFKRDRKVERRGLPRRLLVNPPVHVSVGESRTDLLYDLSEGGFSVYGLIPKKRDEIIPVTFDLPPGGKSIQANAEIAWTNTVTNRTGLRFLNVPNTSRERLAKWMADPYYTARPARSALKPAEPIRLHTLESEAASVARPPSGESTRLGPIPIAPQPMPEREQPVLGRIEAGERSRAGKAWLVIGILVGVALLVLAFATLRSRSPQIAQTGKSTDMAATAPPPVSAPKGSAAPANSTVPAKSSQPALRGPATSPLDSPGFVLQAGAMRSEDNAVALSNALRKKNFPAFSFKRGSDPFYRVVVGPYADKSSAMRAKSELQREKVETFMRRWVPE